MSRLLINEPPLMVLPSLAAAIGLPEAIVLQQVHYWLGASKFEFEGRKWVYNTYKEWADQFPFFSDSTIRRAVSSLKATGLIDIRNLSNNSWDKTNYYTIEYQKLDEITASADAVKLTKCRQKGKTPCGQTDSIDTVNLTISKRSKRPSLVNTKTTTETTTETTSRPSGLPAASSVVDVVVPAEQKSLAGVDVEEVFEYYKAVMVMPRAMLDDKRRKLIVKALAAYSVADIRQAIRGCSKSPFHMGKNDRSTNYNQLNLILRDYDKIDSFMALDAGQAVAPQESIAEANARIMSELGMGRADDDDNTIEMEQ